MITCEELIRVDKVIGVLAYKVKLKLINQHKVRMLNLIK